MMARTVAEKYWLSEIARKESRFLSTGLRTATTMATPSAHVLLLGLIQILRPPT